MIFYNAKFLLRKNGAVFFGLWFVMTVGNYKKMLEKFFS